MMTSGLSFRARLRAKRNAARFDSVPPLVIKPTASGRPEKGGHHPHGFFFELVRARVHVTRPLDVKKVPAANSAACCVIGWGGPT